MRRNSIRFSVLSIWASSTRAMSTSPRKQAVAAIAQLRSTSNKWENLLDIAKCARLAKQKGASMLFLPECFGFMGENSAQTLEHAEDPNFDDGKQNGEQLSSSLVAEISGQNRASCSVSEGRIYLIDGLRTIARESGLWISGGGMHVSGASADPESGNARVYNTHVILDDTGEVKARYRKIHLFDVSIPGKVQLRESATTAPGTELVLCDSPIGKLGLSTCYDVRFPEMYIPLVERGAQILLVPSAFTVPTGSAHWHTLLKARAIETQCYVLAAAQYGKHNEKRESFGHSLAVDPWGRVIADAGGYPIDNGGNDSVEATEPPSIVLCHIDLDTLDSTRQRMPVQQHRMSAEVSFLKDL